VPPKKKAPTAPKPEADVVYSFEVDEKVVAEVMASDGELKGVKCRILSRKPLEGEPIYWLLPVETKFPLQHVRESQILRPA
jgi:hypothetical protein